MKNKLLFLIVVCLMALPMFSYAQSATSSNKIRDRVREEMTQKKEEVKNAAGERRQNAVGKIKERLDKFVGNVIERHEAAIERLETLVTRIESRMVKLEAKNIDVKKSRELLVTAKSKIEIARVSVSDIASSTGNMYFGSTTAAVREDFKLIQSRIEKAKGDIKAAHAALVNVVSNLKVASSTTPN